MLARSRPMISRPAATRRVIRSCGMPSTDNSNGDAQVCGVVLGRILQSGASAEPKRNRQVVAELEPPQQPVRRRLVGTHVPQPVVRRQADLQLTELRGHGRGSAAFPLRHRQFVAASELPGRAAAPDLAAHRDDIGRPYLQLQVGVDQLIAECMTCVAYPLQTILDPSIAPRQAELRAADVTAIRALQIVGAVVALVGCRRPESFLQMVVDLQMKGWSGAGMLEADAAPEQAVVARGRPRLQAPDPGPAGRTRCGRCPSAPPASRG